MIPLYKLLSLLLRVFSRPLINLTKRYHANNQIKNDWVRRQFYTMGIWFHKIENKINRRYLKMDPATTAKPMAEPQAIDKGIEFFYEILFYLIAVGFPMYEVYRQVVDTKAKETKLGSRVSSICRNVHSITDKTSKICEMVAAGHG